MRTIAILNQKGGVGKTTTAVNMSAALADLGRRVCLVDLDPQAHATLHLTGEAVPDGPSLYDLLVGRAAWDEVVERLDDTFWRVGSDIHLAAAEIELASLERRETILHRHLEAVEDRYDDLVIDCPPSLGILTLNALAAVGEVIIPLQPHFLALQGLSRLLETAHRVAAHINPRLRISGIVLCMYDQNTRLAAEVRQEVEAFLEAGRDRPTPWARARLFKRTIRRNVRLAEAPSFGQTIFQYAPDSHGAEDYAGLAEEVRSIADKAIDPAPATAAPA